MRPGSVLEGRYQVVRELGRGGSGTVYLCHDLRLPGSTWAAKEVAFQQGTEAFAREASLLATLKHAGLPVVVDFFVHRDRYYLVQEFVEGPTLHEHVEEHGPVHPRLALEWGLELAEILDYLHSHKPPVTHNDLKPKNVVSTAAGLKLIDFGLARFKAEDMLPAGEASGSLSFSPPEQWRGAYTEFADVYSWGATLYYLLSGHPPSPVPAEHRIRNRRPDVDVETERLILSCLEADPNRRPSSAAEIAQALQFHLAKMPAPSRPYRPDRIPSPLHTPIVRPHAPRRGRAGLLAAAVCLVVLLAGLSISHRPVQQPVLPPPESLGWPDGLQVPWAALSEGRPQEAVRLLQQTGSKSALSQLLQGDAELLLSKPANLQRVPVLLPVTGEYRESGTWMLEGLVVAQEDLRQAGQPIVYDLWDMRSQGQECLARMQAYTGNPSVHVVIGPFGSQNLLLVAPLCNVARLPVVAPSANDPRIAEAGPYVFAVAHSQKARMRGLIRAFRERNLRRGVIFQLDAGYIFAAASDALEAAVRENGGEIEQRVHYTNDPERAVGEWTQRDCDFVFVAENRGAIAGRMVKALRRAGYKGVIATLGHSGSQEFLQAAGADSEGVLVATPIDPESREPRVRHFADSFAAHFPGVPLSSVCAVTYDTALVVGQSLKGGASRQHVHDYLSAIGRQQPWYEGVSGRFRPSLYGLEHQEPGEGMDMGDSCVLVTVRDGRYQVVRQRGEDDPPSSRGPLQVR